MLKSAHKQFLILIFIVLTELHFSCKIIIYWQPKTEKEFAKVRTNTWQLQSIIFECHSRILKWCVPHILAANNSTKRVQSSQHRCTQSHILQHRKERRQDEIFVCFWSTHYYENELCNLRSRCVSAAIQSIFGPPLV